MKKVIAIAALLLMIMLAACTEEEESNDATKERIASVEVEEVVEGDLVVERTLFGRTAPNNMTPVMLQNPGEVDVLEVEEGEMVDEDDRIATIATAVGNQNIYAPKSGKIVSLEATEEGQMVSNENPFVMIADMDTMKLQFTVTAEILSHLEKEDKLTAIIGGKEYEAEVTSVGQMPNDTGLYPIEATVENDEGDIITGVVAQMNVPVSRVENTFLVPTAAIVDESDETFVYVVKDDQVILTAVTIQETQSDQTAVEGELAAGDQVVVNGQLLLSDGTKVTIVEEGGE